MLLYTDEQIEEFCKESKPLPENYYTVLIDNLRTRDAFKRSSLIVMGVSGNEYGIHIRKSKENPLDFSVIFLIKNKIVTGDFILRRYNGKSHQHTNNLEGEKFRDFHIHYATERYQQLGSTKPEKYARITDRYSDIVGALDCLLEDCGFILPDNQRRRLL